MKLLKKMAFDFDEEKIDRQACEKGRPIELS